MEPLDLVAGGLGAAFGIAITILWRALLNRGQLKDQNDNQLLRLALHAAGAGTFFYDAEKDETFWDPRSSEMFGLSSGPMRVQAGSWESMVHPDDLPRILEEIDRAAKGRQEFDYEYRVLKPNGGTAHIRGVGYIDRDAHGRVSRIQGLHFNLTPQKKREEALQKATEQAHRSATAKADFLAMMSHEIRTPMNGILGMADLLNDTGLDQKQHTYVSTLRSSGELLLNILNDILDLSKLEAGKLKLETTEFKLVDVLKHSLQLHTKTSSEKNIFFTGWIDEQIPDVLYGDPVRLSQITNNLLSNAFKFTEKGHIFIWFELASYSKYELKIELHVSDTGIGIDENYIPKLFQSFSQKDSSTSRKYGGTGLGLSIVKNIADIWGAEIEVESTINEGTEFTITLPFVEHYYALKDRRPADGSYLIATRFPGFRKALKQMLPLKSEQIRVVNSEADLWRELESKSDWSNVILEQRFSDQNSSDIAKKIKDSHSDIEITITCFEKYIQYIPEGVRYLRKPFFLNELVFENTSDKLPEIQRPTTKAVKKTSTKTFDHSALIVDDNAINRMVLIKLLNKLGYDCKEAEDGNAGLAACDKTHYDVIFMDFEMPGMNGTDVTRHLRNQGYKYPIIGISAHAFEQYRNQSLLAGMNDYLTKPVKIDQLKEVLTRFN